MPPMLSLVDGEGDIVGRSCGGVDFLNGFKASLNTVDWKDRVKISGYDRQFSWCDKASQICHFKIKPCGRDIVAPTIYSETGIAKAGQGRLLPL